MIMNFQNVLQTNSDSELFVSSSFGNVPGPERARELNSSQASGETTIGLMRRVFFSGTAIPQVVVFAGVEHGSGCTSLCASTASSLAAHIDGLVCAVDGDLRWPSLHRHFEIESPPIANEEYVSVPVRQNGRQPGTTNLWFMSGGAPDGLRTAQSFDRLRSRVPELRKDFTNILIDAPPINAYADAALLGQLADGVVMILEANSTRREAALRAKQALDAAGARLLGAVLNKRTFPIPERLYKLL